MIELECICNKIHHELHSVVEGIKRKRKIPGDPPAARRVGSGEECLLVLAEGEQLPNLVAIRLVDAHLVLDFVPRVHDRRVVFLLKFAGDLRQRIVGQFAGEVHRDLTRRGDTLVTPLLVHLLDREAVCLGDLLLDELDGDTAGQDGVDDALEHFGGQFGADRRLRHGGVGHDTDESPFEFADIRGDDFGDERGHLVGHRDLLGLRLLAQNRFPRLEIGRLNVGLQSPLEARAQAGLQRLNLLRWPIARDDQLPLRLME